MAKKKKAGESTDGVNEATEPSTEVVEDVPEDELMGTSARLFADLMEPAQEEEQVVEDETGEVVVKPETTEGNPETDTEIDIPEYLSLEDFKDKKVKVKVDGQESEVSFAELIKGYQTDKHLTLKGQKIGEEQRMLEMLKQNLPQINRPEAKADDSVDDSDEYTDPKILAQAKEIAALKMEIDNTLAPIRREQALKAIATNLQSKDPAYDDFMAKIPQIEEQILSLPVEQQAMYDSELGFTNIYIGIKNAELRAAMKKTPEPTKPDERAQPKLTRVEGSGGSPSGADDSASQYAKEFERWQDTGDMTKLLQLKGYI